MKSDGETTPLWVGLAGLLPLFVAAGLVAVRDVTASANVALLLVAVVVLIAAASGPDAGAIAAISAALSFAFFHTQPYLHLRIASGDDVETTVLLLVVGLAVGHVAAAGRRARQAAHESLGEMRRLHRVAELLAQDEHASAVIAAAQTQLVALLHLRECVFEAPPQDSEVERLERNGTLAAHRYRYQADGGMELPEDGIELTVICRGWRAARFVLHPGSNSPVTIRQRIAAVAIADQVGGGAGHADRVAPRRVGRSWRCPDSSSNRARDQVRSENAAGPGAGGGDREVAPGWATF